jgi:hypothetical protein
VTFGLVSVILVRRLDALERRYVVLARAVAVQEAVQDRSTQTESPDEAPDE